MRIFRLRHRPKNTPSLRWRIFGISILLASLALGAWIKIKWSYWLVDQVVPGKKVYSVLEMRQQADSLNHAIPVDSLIPFN